MDCTVSENPLLNFVGGRYDETLTLNCCLLTDSLLYLPVAEATILTFLAPILACAACSFLIHEPFTRTDQIAGLTSLLGVVLIAHPASLFDGTNPSIAGAQAGLGSSTGERREISNAGSFSPSNATAEQRLSAVGFAMVGVFGSAVSHLFSCPAETPTL
jgi:drug/metabolite transporter (DMT)-like permease